MGQHQNWVVVMNCAVSPLTELNIPNFSAFDRVEYFYISQLY